MSSQLPSKNLSQFITQWTTRLTDHKKKIATEEKITEMKLGSKTAYYIQHTEESTLPSADKRRQILLHYKNFVQLIEHLINEKKITEEINPLLERAKVPLENSSGKKTTHAGLNKAKQLISDFQKELNTFIEAQKKSQPSGEIKR